MNKYKISKLSLLTIGKLRSIFYANSLEVN